MDAATSLLELMDVVTEDVRANKLIMNWLLGGLLRIRLKWSIQSMPSEFTHRCVSKLEATGDDASNAMKHDEAIAAYFAALSISHSTLDTLLLKWASKALIHCTANEALGAATKVFCVLHNELNLDIDCHLV